MKNIKVTDQMYNALMTISENLNNQDHRSTKMPYLLQVVIEKEVAAYPGCGTEIWVNDEGSEIRNSDEIDQFLIDEGIEIDFLDELDKESQLEDLGYREIIVTTEDQYKEFFLTEKALRDFYGDDVRTFLQSSNSPELEVLMKFLCELSGGKIHK